MFLNILHRSNMGIQRLDATPQTQAALSWEQIGAAYEKTVKKIIDFLRSYQLRSLSNIIGTQLLEPWSSFKCSLAYPLGLVNKFQFFGLNPDRITPEQAQKRPLLLLHGNMHNQSAWLSLAKVLQHSDGGPIYTVNLNNGPLTEDDRLIIYAKIEEIKRHYAEHGIDDVKIDIGGHSRGARMAFYSALTPNSWKIDAEGKPKVYPKRIDWRDDIGHIFRIGYPTSPKQDSWINGDLRDRIYEIDGIHDCLVDDRSIADRDHRVSIDCGHLALLHAPEMHAQVDSWRRV